MGLLIRYLKDEVYYNDLYDLWTVEEYLRICEYWGKRSKDGEAKLGKWGLDLKLYFVIGEHYRGMKVMLEKCMLAERNRTEQLSTRNEPKGTKTDSILNFCLAIDWLFLLQLVR